jgi:chemotaxis protein MotB
MARKKKPEEHENHERWLVSYADFITLLFAFFVVMYSISSVNEGKYRVLSDSIVAAFDPTREGLPIKLSSPLKPPILERDIVSPTYSQSVMQNKYPEVPAMTQASEKDKKNLLDIARQVEKNMADLIDQDIVNLKKNDLWIEIEIKSSILFDSGSAALGTKARPVLRKVAAILAKYPNQIQVEGFTDNVPISTVAYPSNWELSAARAASVVHLFANAGIKPERMSAIGYGQYKPIASNDTAKGRSQNRRINVVLLSDAIARRTNRTEQLEETLAAKRLVEAGHKAPAQGGGAPAVNLLPPVRQLPGLPQGGTP